MGSYDAELAAYRLLHRLQGRHIFCLFSIVRLCITPEPASLHPVTDDVQGLVLEYIPGDRCTSVVQDLVFVAGIDTTTTNPWLKSLSMTSTIQTSKRNIDLVSDVTHMYDMVLCVCVTNRVGACNECRNYYRQH